MARPAGVAGQYLLMLWAALTLNFLLPHMAPGAPVDYLSSAATALSPAAREALTEEFDLDGSLVSQYGRYWDRMAHADLGTSVRYRRPVVDLLAERLPWTLLLVGAAMAVSLVTGVLAAVAAATHRGRRRDVGLVTGVLIIQAMPTFWIGMVLVAVFAVQLGWLPSFGAVPLDRADGLAWAVEVARRLVLPTVTMALGAVGSIFLLVRASMVSTLGSPYVLMAEAKGAPPRSVAYHHALRNALLPAYTHLALSLGVLISGAVVVETVFSYPGMGRLVYEAVLARDYLLLQGAFVCITLAVVAANLVADLTYPLLDPRVRRRAAGGRR